MLHEKPHDNFHWKNKLDELDHLPGEPLADKAAAWEKLQGRMQQKSRNRRTIPYWMAAACLVLAIGVSWFLIDQQDSSHLQAGELQTGNKPVTKPLPVIKNIDSADHDTKELKDEQPTMMAQLKNKKPVRVPMATAPTGEQATLIPDTVAEPSLEVTSYTQNYGDTIASIAVVPLKKKMKVVHINELSRPEDVNPLVKKHAAPSFQTKPFIQDDGLISISRNASDNLIKIKLSPSN